ncbi:hypothetical protein Trydic_g5660 [Trypoxylus dichotomus]
MRAIYAYENEINICYLGVAPAHVSASKREPIEDKSHRPSLTEESKRKEKGSFYACKFGKAEDPPRGDFRRRGTSNRFSGPVANADKLISGVGKREGERGKDVGCDVTVGVSEMGDRRFSRKALT